MDGCVQVSRHMNNSLYYEELPCPTYPSAIPSTPVFIGAHITCCRQVVMYLNGERKLARTLTYCCESTFENDYGVGLTLVVKVLVCEC